MALYHRDPDLGAPSPWPVRMPPRRQGFMDTLTLVCRADACNQGRKACNQPICVPDSALDSTEGCAGLPPEPQPEPRWLRAVLRANAWLRSGSVAADIAYGVALGVLAAVAIGGGAAMLHKAIDPGAVVQPAPKASRATP